MDARRSGVLQSLFVRRAPDGRSWEFAAMANGGCGVLCDGEVVVRGDGSEETVEYLLREFLRSSGTRVQAAPNATHAPPPPPPEDAPNSHAV